MSDKDNLILEAAVFGREVELFLESNVGLYVSQCCAAEVESAVEKLKRVDPSEPEKVRELQNQIWRAESVMAWLKEAVNSGAQAKEALTL